MEPRATPELWVNLLGIPFSHFLPVARRAEELGFAGVAVADHLVIPDRIESEYPGGARHWDQQTDWPDAWVAIGAMAAVTSKLRFVTNVSVIALRHPLVTAKAVATAASLAPGRVILGVGVGWMPEEFIAMGRPFQRRGAMTDDAMAILRAAWRDGVVEHRGPHDPFPAVHVRPVPPSPVPIWVGGESEAARRRAIERGDGWMSGRQLSTALRDAATMCERRRQARPGEPFDIAVSATGELTANDVERAAEAGVSHIKVTPWTSADVDCATRLTALDRFADQHLQ